MIGNPKYSLGERVSFTIDGSVHIGTIAIIDSYGTFFDDSDVSYDILSKNCLFKHVTESLVSKV